VHPARPSVGLSRPDWEVFAGLALALGGDLGFETLEEIDAEMARLLGPREVAVPPAGEPAVTAAPDLELFSYPLLIDEGRLSEHTPELKAALQEPAFAEIHPQTAAAANLDDAEEILVRTNQGSARLPVRISDGVAPGVVFVPFNQPGLAANTLLGGTWTEPAAIEAVAADAEGAA